MNTAYYCCITAMIVAAAGTAPAQRTEAGKYLENTGQINDGRGCPDPSVRYSLAAPGMNLHLRDGGFSYDAYLTVAGDAPRSPAEERGTGGVLSAKQRQPELLYFHRVDVAFQGGNPRAQIVPAEPDEHFSTYYTTGSVRRPAQGIRRYGSVTYRNIYPDIDVTFRVRPDGLPEYDVIVRPGGDVQRVKFRYDGQNSIALAGNALKLGLWGGGTLTERMPSSYERETGRNVAVRYTLDGNVAGFAAPDREQFATVVIDPSPVLLWGRYYGGSKRDIATSMALDAENNIYITGSTASDENIATSGAHQTVLRRDYDIVIAKFNPDGLQLWGTYFGGLYFDSGNSIAVSGNDVAIAGHAESDSLASDLAHQTAKYGFSDCLLSVFSADSGLLRWSTYIGGAAIDDGYAVLFTSDGNICAGGVAVSDSNIATPGAHQETYNKGIVHGDAFLVKFTPDGKRLWGTYYGGEFDDYCYDLAADIAGNIYMVGATRSFAYIATNNSHKVERSGGAADSINLADAFIAKFTSGGNRLWATYYGGRGADYFNGATSDIGGNVYLAGWTKSADGIAAASAYQTAIADSARGDAFVVKFNVNGVRQWATYYGGSDLDFAADIALDKSGTAYITGYTYSDDRIAWRSAYQTRKGGGSNDAFAAKFTWFGSYVWGTYFGGTGSEYGNAVAAEPEGKIVIAGWTESDNAIALNGAGQAIRRGERDVFLAKFDAIGTDVDESDAPQKLTVATVQQPGGLFVTIAAARTGAMTLRLSDLTGKILHSREIAAEQGVQSFVLPADALPVGVYFITVSDGISMAGTAAGIIR